MKRPRQRHQSFGLDHGLTGLACEFSSSETMTTRPAFAGQPHTMTGPHGPFLTGTKLMLPDDESLLSAYLDGELGREEHEAVESFLNSDPRLAETLRGLVGVRDLLADLSRPVAGDAAPEVMRRLGEIRPGFRPWRTVKHPIRWVRRPAGGRRGAGLPGRFHGSAARPPCRSWLHGMSRRPIPAAVPPPAGKGKNLPPLDG